MKILIIIEDESNKDYRGLNQSCIEQIKESLKNILVNNQIEVPGPEISVDIYYPGLNQSNI